MQDNPEIQPQNPPELPQTPTAQHGHILTENVLLQDILISERSGRQKLESFVSTEGFRRLNLQKGIVLKQKVEFREAVTGCETKNRFHLLGWNPSENKELRLLFKGKENSDFCARYCLTGDCRPLNMTISTTALDEDGVNEPFLSLSKRSTCTCVCYNQPEIQVTLVEGGKKEFVGRIVEIYSCCDVELNIYDNHNTLKYIIKGRYYQAGMWCQLPCTKCQSVGFEIRLASGEVASRLKKRTRGCLDSLILDTDNFTMEFPKDCSAADKALLMSALLFLDYRFFENHTE